MDQADKLIGDSKDLIKNEEMKWDAQCTREKL